MKKEQGITLIALIITIIILLILAAIAVKMLIGENGILQNAGKAQEKYQEQTIKEELAVKIINLQIEIATNETEKRQANINDIEKIEGVTNFTKTEEEGASLDYKGYHFMLDHKIIIQTVSKAEASLPLQEDPLVPLMTDYTSPKGKVTASSENLADSRQDYSAWRAFNEDGIPWSTWPNLAPGEWIMYEFDQTVKISKIEIKTNNTTSVKDFSIYGSNDGINFEVIYQGTCIDKVESQFFTLKNYSKEYKFVKLQINSSYSEEAAVAIRRIQYYGIQ